MGPTLNADIAFYYPIVCNATAISLKPGFGATIGQGFADEAWGVENIRIEDNSQPSGLWAPATLALLGMAGIGFNGRRMSRRID